jgi:hypothetical protein
MLAPVDNQRLVGNDVFHWALSASVFPNVSHQENSRHCIEGVCDASRYSYLKMALRFLELLADI